MTPQIDPMALIRQLLDENGYIPALTIHQPWASLLACRAKQYETRGWATKYRGWVLIHAGVGMPYNPYLCERKDDIHFTSALYDHGITSTGDLPRGKIIAIAELVNCWHMVHMPGTDIDVAKHIEIGAELDVPRKHPDFHRYIVPTEQELLFGDWQPGRFAWEFKNMLVLPEPIPAKGFQRLWRWKGDKSA